MEKYIKPAVDVIELNVESPILDGSNGTLSLGHDFDGNDDSFSQE